MKLYFIFMYLIIQNLIYICADESNANCYKSSNIHLKVCLTTINSYRNIPNNTLYRTT